MSFSKHRLLWCRNLLIQGWGFLVMMRIFNQVLANKAAVLGALLMSVFATIAHAVNDLPGGPAVNQLNLHPAATRIADSQAWLHWFMLIICAVIFVAVFSVMFYSIWKHRKSVGHKAASFHESLTVEVIWTAVPFILVIGMALPATKVVIAMKDTTNADLTIKVTGMQWKWGYDYLRGEGEGIGFISALDRDQRELSNQGGPKAGADIDDYLLKVDHPLVVPVGRKIRLIMTSNDVIHSWAMPSFGVHQDAIPGFVRDTWFRTDKVGDYYGQCAKICGKEHAYMPIHVQVLSAADYSQWVEGENKKMAAKADDPGKIWAAAEITKRGEKVYAANCAACHQPTGKGLGPIKPLDGSAVVLDADKSKQIDVVLNGRTIGPVAMPSWKQLSDTDIAAVITYTKNNWSNKTGQVVQPSEITQARK
jgi:cytochrome c oxidase subunit 2